jgi:hypothetical protein
MNTYDYKLSNRFYLTPLEQLHRITSTYCRQLSHEDWENAIKFRKNLILDIKGFKNRHVLKSKYLVLISIIDENYLSFIEHMKQYPDRQNPLHNPQFSYILDELIKKYYDEL